MDQFRAALQAVIDQINKVLTEIDNRVPSVARPLIPGYVQMSQLRDILQLTSYYLSNGGDSDQLRQAAAILQQFASSLTKFSDETVKVSNLAATDPNVWTDVNASTAYIQRVSDQAMYFGNAETWAQAIGTGLNDDADTIDDFYERLNSAIRDMVAAVVSLASAVVEIILSVAEMLAAGLGLVTIVPSILSFVNAYISFLNVFPEIQAIGTMQAPTISPTASGQSWPEPVLW